MKITNYLSEFDHMSTNFFLTLIFISVSHRNHINFIVNKKSVNDSSETADVYKFLTQCGSLFVSNTNNSRRG